MQAREPRRRLREEPQNSPRKASASPSSSPLTSHPISATKEALRRQPLLRSQSDMPYIPKDPEEEVMERPRRHRHHHHHHHHNESRYDRNDRSTSSSMEDNSSPDDRPMKVPSQRPPMVRRAKTSGGSFAGGLFKKKLGLGKDNDDLHRSLDKDVDRPKMERRESARTPREMARGREPVREPSLSRDLARHHQQKEARSYSRENGARSKETHSDHSEVRRGSTHHHRGHKDREREREREREDKHRNYVHEQRRSGDDVVAKSKSKPKQERSEKEEKPRGASKSRDIGDAAVKVKEKERARAEAAHKKKTRRNVLSEILLHEQKLLVEQNLPPTRAPPQPPKFVECNTCLSDDIPEDQSAKLACGHIFCNDCLVRLFNLSLTDPAHMPPRCCQPDTHIPLKHVDKLLSTKTKIRWNKKYQEFTTANRMYCPQVDCGEWIRPKDFQVIEGVKVGKCSRCKLSVCGMCGLKEHGQEECPKDEELNNVRELGKENGWQRCYNCRAMVELERGCNHMTCRCTAEFCMICAAKWKTCNCPWFNFEPGEDDAPPPQFDENGRLLDEDLAWGDGPRQNGEDERLARQLAQEFEDMDDRRERGGGAALWAPLIAGAIGGLLTRTRNLEGAAMERLRRAYASALEDDFTWGESSSDEDEEEEYHHHHHHHNDHDHSFWNFAGRHPIHI